MIGDPPTNAVALGKSSYPNHGLIKNDRTTESPLNIPKKLPKAKNNRT